MARDHVYETSFTPCISSARIWTSVTYLLNLRRLTLFSNLQSPMVLATVKIRDALGRLEIE